MLKKAHVLKVCTFVTFLETHEAPQNINTRVMTITCSWTSVNRFWGEKKGILLRLGQKHLE